MTLMKRSGNNIKLKFSRTVQKPALTNGPSPLKFAFPIYKAQDLPIYTRNNGLASEFRIQVGKGIRISSSALFYKRLTGIGVENGDCGAATLQLGRYSFQFR